jgi:hypothetical protein
MVLKSDKSLNKLLIIAAFIIQAIGALYVFPPTQLLNQEPLYTIDYPAFLYRCVAMSEFLSKSGNLGGYDPYLKAGYVFPSLMGDGSRTLQLLTRLFPSGWTVSIIKWYVMAAFLVIPLILYLAARTFDASERETAILLIFGLLLWWIPVHPYWLAAVGLVNFVLVSYLSLYIAALFYKLTTQGGWRPGLLLTVLIPLAVLLHMGTIVLMLPVVAVCASLFGRSRKIYLYLLLFLITTLALNGFWLIPYLQDSIPHMFQSAFTAPAPAAGDSAWTKHLVELDLLKHLKSFFLGAALPLAVLAVAGFYKLSRRGDGVRFYMFLAAASFFALLTYFGSFVQATAIMQPLRFKSPMLLFLLLPTAIGFNYLYEKALQRYKNLKPILMPAILCLLCIVALCAIPIRKTQGNNLNAKLNENGRELIEWIKTNTDKNARILLEGDDLSIHLGYPKYYGGHLPMLLPYLTKREFVSTTFPNMDFTGFSDGLLFTQDIRWYGLEDFKKYFELYNINWIVCWSDQSVDALMAYPEYMPLMNKIDRFYIFGVNRKPSYYIKGSGEVKADYDALYLTNIKSVDGSIIIKYHWVDGLRTTPERVLRPAYMGLDPYGFIEILDPPDSITVHYLR